MSLISINRSLPDEWIVLANSVCFKVKLPSGFLLSWSERMSRLLSGVRSSWDMLAKNSDLYLDVRASCLVFAFDLLVLVGKQLRFFLQLFVGFLKFFLTRLQLLGERLRLLEQIFGAH